MGIDCQFQAADVTDIDRVAALDGVGAVFRPGMCSWAEKRDHWTITTQIGEGYPPGDRGPRVAALLRALRPYCVDLEYGGDCGSAWLVPVTDELILKIEEAR